MGLYVNPPGMFKEKFLQNYGNHVTREIIEQFQFDKDITVLPCCLVDNGLFTACGVGFDKDELRSWLDPRDPRPKSFYLVNKDVLRQQHLSGITEREYKLYVGGE